MAEIPRLKAEGIEMRFPGGESPLVVLRGAALELAAGRSAAILGPSGSGKSTLLNILGGLQPPAAGRVLVDGADLYKLDERELARFRNRRIGFVFQEALLLPQCAALENVLIPTLAGTRANAGARGRELLARVGLSQRLGHRPGELSGGERQRVALARALINQPSLLLADEPTGNLDRAAAGIVGELLLELARTERAALLVVTHSEALAARFDERYELVDGVLRAMA